MSVFFYVKKEEMLLITFEWFVCCNLIPLYLTLLSGLCELQCDSSLYLTLLSGLHVFKCINILLNGLCVLEC